MGIVKNIWRGISSESSSTTSVHGNSNFATRLYHKLADTKAGNNLFLSPFSIQVALAMCAVGAKGETRKVMADLIGAPENVEEQNRQYAELLKSVHGEGERPFQLTTANALWGQQGYRFKSDFQEAIADFYDGALHEVDFRARPDEAVKTINAWVSDKTREKIKDLISRDLINDDTRLILTNAIYFKGKWEQEFMQAKTRDEYWYGPNGFREVPMMHQSGEYLYYYESDGFQALDLPYKGRQLSMLIVLPRKKDGLTLLERQWVTDGTYHQVTDRLKHEGTVTLSLPRFKIEAHFTLNPVLRALGADLALSDTADFSGIGEEPLKISEVVHMALVEVSEQGTEAAAATGVVMAGAPPGPPPPPKVFKADHPFLFFIRDPETNVVLFSGRLLDPR
jgi:serpin B